MNKKLLIVLGLCVCPLLSQADFGGLWKSGALWLSPESMQVDANNNLISWTDRTGKNILTPTVRRTSPNPAECPGNIPTVTPNVINGFAAMNLDGTIAYEGNESGTYRSVFMLAKPTTTDGVLFGLREDSDITTHPYFAKTVTGMILHDGTSSQSTGAPSSNLSLYGMVYGNPAFDILSVNGMNYTSTTSKLTRNIQPGFPMIGQRIYSFDRAYGRLSGQIVELVAFNQVLSEIERWHVESYFAFKYGLNLLGFHASSPYTNTVYRRYVTSDLSVVWDGSASDLSSCYQQMNFVVRDDSAMLNIHHGKTRLATGALFYQVVNGSRFSVPAALNTNLSYAICGTNPVLNTSGTYIKARKMGKQAWCWDKQFRFRQKNVPVVSMQINLASDQLSLVNASVVGALCMSASDTLYRKGVYNAATGVLTLDSLPLSDKTTLRLVFNAIDCVPISGINPGSVSAWSVGTAVNQTFRVINETDTYRYTLASGVLPGGLQLRSDGLVYGTPTERGTFPIVVRASSSIGGCTFDKAYTLNVIESPINRKTASICQGETYPFRGKNYTLAGEYADTVPQTNGTDSIYILNLTVHPVYSHTLQASISGGESYTLNGKQYQTSGEYRDTLQTAQGCDSVFVLQLEVTPTGASQRAYFGLQVYPNPASSQVMIQTKSTAQAITVELLDQNGVRIKTEVWPGGTVHQKSWDLQMIPAGMYYLRFTAGNQVCVERLVKY